MTIVVIVLAVVILVLLVLLDRAFASAQRRVDSVTAQERARQDQLLNRLASRTPGEYVALTQTLAEATIQHSPPSRVRHLYDATGLIHDEVDEMPGAED